MCVFRTSNIKAMKIILKGMYITSTNLHMKVQSGILRVDAAIRLKR